MSRRVLSMVLCLCLLVLCLPAFSESGGDTQLTMAGFDGTNTYRSWADCRFFERMAELTVLSRKRKKRGYNIDSAHALGYNLQ